MTQHTKEVEREVIVTEEEEYWTCDDCGIEHDVDDLVPVAVDPDGTTDVEISFLDRRGILERRVESAIAEYEADELPEIDISRDNAGQRVRSGLAEAISSEIAPTIVVDGPDVQCAALVDACPTCLEDDFTITLEEHDGVRYEERNIQIDEWDGLERVERVGIILTMALVTYASLGLSLISPAVGLVVGTILTLFVALMYSQ